MLRLECSDSADDDIERLSRIAVLETSHSYYDYALATGHAVPDDRPCEVSDFQGGRSDVDLIRFADNYHPGAQTDWAIIRFPKISTPDLIRYKLDPLGDIDSLAGTEVRFATARGLPENAQICQLTILQFREDERHVAHDCRSIQGQSGSPVTRFEQGQHRLVGLHIGQLWMWDSPETGRPDRKGYINLLNSETVQEIETVIAANP